MAMRPQRARRGMFLNEWRHRTTPDHDMELGLDSFPCEFHMRRNVLQHAQATGSFTTRLNEMTHVKTN